MQPERLSQDAVMVYYSQYGWHQHLWKYIWGQINRQTQLYIRHTIDVVYWTAVFWQAVFAVLWLVLTDGQTDSCCSRRSVKEPIDELTNILLSVFYVLVWVAWKWNSPVSLQERRVIRQHKLSVVVAQCVTKLRVGDRKRLLNTVYLFHFTVETLQ